MAILKIRDPETGLFQEITVIKGEQGIPGGDLTTASQLPIVDAGAYFTSTNVEDALQEIGSALGSLSAAAADISIVDSGTYFAATNVETALAEIATTKAPIASPTFTGTVTVATRIDFGTAASIVYNPVTKSIDFIINE